MDLWRNYQNGLLILGVMLITSNFIESDDLAQTPKLKFSNSEQKKRVRHGHQGSAYTAGNDFSRS